MEQLGSHWIDCLNFTLEDFSKSVVKIQLLLKNLTRITGTFFYHTSIFIRVRNVSDKKIENRAIYKIKLKNME